MLVTLLILIVAIALFITEKLRVDIVAFSVVVSLMLTGVLTTSEALSGFSNAAVLTIAALFVVGGGVLQTGLAGQLGRKILAVAGNKPGMITLVLMVAAALLSSFLSDTGTVAVLLPATIVLARSAKISPSKLLIPLSYGALLGGSMTLIGTTPNLIVAELLEEQGISSFTFFSFTPLGIVLLIIGVVFMLFIGRHLLPDRSSKIESQPVENPGEILDRYRLPDDLYHLRVRADSPLIGQPLSDSRLGQDYQIIVLEIKRRHIPRQSNVSFRDLLNVVYKPTHERDIIIPLPETLIHLDDLLTVQGKFDQITRATSKFGLGIQSLAPTEEDSLINQEVGIAEILLPPRSTLAGKNIVDLHFGSYYKLNVLGLNRPNNSKPLDPKSTSLRFGDILLVQGPWKNILALRQKSRDFVVLGQPESMLSAPRQEKASLAMGIMVLMLILMITNIVSVATASLLGALLIVLTGCLSMDDAYNAIDWKSILLIAGMLPMSIALSKTGLVDLAAQTFTSQLGGLGPIAVLGGLFLITSLFTQVLSNTATTVLVAPIALVAANTLNVQPQAFLMAVAVAASMAFASPVASPVNTLVMGAGNYRFGDYLKVGLPLIFITLVASVLLLPLLFPF